MLLPLPLGPDERHRLAGRELEVDRVEHDALPRRVGEGDSLEPDRNVARARRRRAAPRGAGCRRLLEQIEEALGDGEAVGARVVLGGEVPQRQVELGREHEHRQPGLEAEPAVDQADADRHRDERDPERRRELEHGPGEERDAERAHRRPAVLVADLARSAPPAPRRG